MTDERFDFEADPLEVALLEDMLRGRPAPSTTDNLRKEVLELQAERWQTDKYVTLMERLNDDLARRLHVVESSEFVWQWTCAGVVLGMIVLTLVASVLWGR